jgi:hypothetical protein
MAQPTQYQRVGSTPFDVTEAGVESLGYLSFDGIDDFMVTPTITPGIDKVQVFAGVRKLSDPAGYASLVELSANASTSSGAFVFFAPGPFGPTVNTYVFRSRGTVSAGAGAEAFPAPTTNILAGFGDVAGDSSTLRVDGTQVAQSTDDLGTGNYLAYPMYIGRRGGTLIPFNGQLYSLITRFGPNLELAQIESTEAYVAGKTAGVTI